MTLARRNALFVLGAAVAVVAIVILLSGGGGYTIKAELRDAGGLRVNSSVKVAGVPAGSVKSITVTSRDTAIATLEIDKDALPIGQGASVQVRPTDLLGERYASLDPGDRSRPVSSGTVIPMSRTSQPVELDDILNTLNPDTRTRLGILINEAGAGLAGRGADFGKLLATLPPSLSGIRGLLDQVDTQDAALKDMIARGDRITASINAKRGDMGKLVDQAAGALQTVAEKRQALGATIANAPAALAELRTTLGQLDSASTALRPAAADLQRTAAPLGTTLRSLPAFTADAAPTLRTATSVAPQLTRLGKRATPTVKRLVPTTKLLQQTLTPAAPALQHMTDRGTNDLLYFINNVNRGLQGRDGISHFIGAHLYVDAEYVSNAINAFNGYHPTSSTKTKTKAPAPPAPSVVNQVKDAVKKVTGQPLTQKLLQKIPLKDLTQKVTQQLARVVPPGTVTKIVGNLVGGLRQRAQAHPHPQPQAQPQAKTSGGDALRLFDYLMGP
ncbi:MAG: hypothetical protein JWN32_1843 [Solirubrobacterales bacterium]|nr:hypothetical protein [Solirubrobacterales bacterium]